MEDTIEQVWKQKKNKLLGARSQIIRMPNNKKRVEMIDAFYNLLHYYSHGTTASLNENYDKFNIEYGNEKYFQYVCQDTAKNLNMIEDNAKVLYDKYKKIVDTYKDNDFCMYRYYGFVKTNPKVLEQAVWDFLQTLGDDVFSIYYNMLLGGNIIRSPEKMANYLGVSYDANPIDNSSVVVIDYPKYLEYYFTIVHEIGHCYQFYLQRNQRDYSTFNPYNEVTSILFEKLFKEYLLNNHIIKDDFQIDMIDHAGLLKHSSVTKVLCDEFAKDDFKLINPFDLSYMTKRPIEELASEVVNDCANLPIDEVNLDIGLMTYSFGHVVAANYLERLKNNFDEEWKNYKNFICTVNYLPMSEVIEDVFDTEIVEESIKKFVKSYHER